LVYELGKSRSKPILAAILVNTHPFSEYPALTSNAWIVSVLLGTVPRMTSQIGSLVALERDWNTSDPGPVPGQCQIFLSLFIFPIRELDVLTTFSSAPHGTNDIK
jgi:hypothetical protein